MRFFTRTSLVTGGAVAVAVAAALLTGCSGLSGGGTKADAAGTSTGMTTYYLALGDSLSEGVQPDAKGVSVETGEGYANQLYATLRQDHPGLRLVKLGCPSETTSTMISGTICHYAAGSQLAAAVAFLRAHRGHVFVVTVDIGANDLEDCLGLSLQSFATCVRTGIPAVVENLTTIMSRLRAASGPGTRIAGMNYYLPALSEWRHGILGQITAQVLEESTAEFNQLLDHDFTAYHASIADVWDAFDTPDFGNRQSVPGIGTEPRNVALVCEWTWECASPPRGPNQHPNQTGYAVITRAFLRAIQPG